MEAPFDIAADLDTPVSAYIKLRAFSPKFLLESVESGERLARYSFLGLGSSLTVELHPDKLNDFVARSSSVLEKLATS